MLLLLWRPPLERGEGGVKRHQRQLRSITTISFHPSCWLEPEPVCETCFAGPDSAWCLRVNSTQQELHQLPPGTGTSHYSGLRVRTLDGLKRSSSSWSPVGFPPFLLLKRKESYFPEQRLSDQQKEGERQKEDKEDNYGVDVWDGPERPLAAGGLEWGNN